MNEILPGYWYSRFVFERGLALLYLVAFLVTANQFVALLGDRGLQPVARFTNIVPFRASPSLFYFIQGNTAYRVTAWAGVAISVVMLSGVPQRLGSIAAALGWGALWMIYLSFVNVGQTFYGFGWETLLLETGFFAMFLGGASTTPTIWMNVVWRWLLFRIMFGAGLIKLRGDTCWRDLTCLNYYFETEPMPNPLTWYFHWLPAEAHRIGVIINHVVELGVPFFYFAPQPLAAAAGLVTILFQGTLIVSGNLSWLNWLTVLLAVPLIPDRWWSWLPVSPPPDLAAPGTLLRVVIYGATALVAALSIGPITNMLSSSQMMNSSFDPLHLVNTYGAFGSVTRVRQEIVIEGTDAARPSEAALWREYGFKGKPGDPARRPRQFAPYHLRLDWLMWFAAMQPVPTDDWFIMLATRLLEGDRDTISLLDGNPFPDAPPTFLRARYYTYHFTTPEEHRKTGLWWRRELVGEFLPVVRLDGDRIRVVR